MCLFVIMIMRFFKFDCGLSFHNFSIEKVLKLKRGDIKIKLSSSLKRFVGVIININ